MTGKQVSKIAILLDRFHITGKELADHLHVDYSLVSKWRSQTRLLTARSAHLNKIIEYFKELDSNTKSDTLKKILSEAYPNAKFETSSEMNFFLKKWLTEINEGEDTHSILNNIMLTANVRKESFYVFEGDEGRWTATIKFLDIALLSPEKTEKIIFSQENYNWFNNNPESQNVWREKNLEFLRRGGKTNVIHTMDRLYKSIAASLLLWLPLHMNPNTVTYYYPQYLDNPMKITLNILKDHVVLFGISFDNSAKISYTFLSTDPVILSQCWRIAQTLWAESLPLFEKYLPRHNEKLAYIMSRMGEKAENNYYVSLPTSFSLLSQELLRKILLDNNISEERVKNYLAEQSRMKQHFYTNSSRYFYRILCDIIKLEHSLSQDHVYLDELSILTGQPIMVSRDIFCQCLEEIICIMESVPNLEIALIDGPPYSGIDDIYIWIKENTIAVLSTLLSDLPSNFSLVTQELTTVNSSFYNFNDVWNSIPQIRHDKNWVKQRLFHTMARFSF